MDDKPKRSTGNGKPPVDGGDGAGRPETEPESEFDRFKDLTRRLLKVPKFAIDEQRQKT